MRGARVLLERRIVLAIGFVVSTAAWFGWFVGPPPSPATAVGLLGAHVVLAGWLGFLVPHATLRIGGSLVSGPCVWAWFTVGRGDGDGLWGLIFLVFAQVASLFAAGAAIGAAVSRREPWARRARDAIRGAIVRARRAWVAVVAAAVGVVALTAIAGWPRPHAELAALAVRLEGALGVRLEHGISSGSPTCGEQPCPAVSYTVDLGPSPAACRGLVGILARATPTAWRSGGCEARATIGLDASRAVHIVLRPGERAFALTLSLEPSSFG